MRSDCIRFCKDLGFSCQGDGIPQKEFKKKKEKKSDKIWLHFNRITLTIVSE